MLVATETLEQILHVIETQPEWRQRFKKALFDIDVEANFARIEQLIEQLFELQRQHSENLARIEKAIEEIFEIQRRHTADIAELKSDMKVVKSDVEILKSDVAILKSDVAVLKDDMSIVKGDVADLKGSSYEREYRDKASGIFGRFIRRGRDRTDDIADQLYDSVAAGIISQADVDQVLASDLLWGGKLRHGDEEVFIVLEASYYAEVHDVERASQRAIILHKAGLNAVPIVAGKSWDEKAQTLANAQAVVVTNDKLVDADSWNAVLPIRLNGLTK